MKSVQVCLHYHKINAASFFIDHRVTSIAACYLPVQLGFLARLWWSTPDADFSGLPADHDPWIQHLVDAAPFQSMPVQSELLTHWLWHKANVEDESERPPSTFMLECFLQVLDTQYPVINVYFVQERWWKWRWWWRWRWRWRWRWWCWWKTFVQNAFRPLPSFHAVLLFLLSWCVIQWKVLKLARKYVHVLTLLWPKYIYQQLRHSCEILSVPALIFFFLTTVTLT